MTNDNGSRPKRERRDWGRIMLVTRLEKTVESQFVQEWSNLIARGLRDGRREIAQILREIKEITSLSGPVDYEGAYRKIDRLVDAALSIRDTDAFLVVKDRVAHQAVNDAVRVFLKSDLDTLCLIDSDWSGGSGYIEDLRSLEDGWDYDIFQGFYTRRGWPPEAIWFKTTTLGDTVQSLVWKDNHTEDTAMVGFHNCLIRREVFEAMLENEPDVSIDEFNWAYYPRHGWQSEDGVFCQNASALGFRIGSTTKVKCGHISRIVSGWETYQEYLKISGIVDYWQGYFDLVELVADFTGETYDDVIAKAARGSQYPRERWIELKPESADEVRSFYGDSNNGYLYNLIAWNVSPTYHKIVGPLEQVEDKRVLIIGAGLGGEIERLKGRNAVSSFELPGVLNDFLYHRYKDELEIDLCSARLFNTSLYGRQRFDLIVMVDVIEHIPPDELEDTLDAALALLADGGEFYIHNNFGAQDLAPQHYDHAERWARWLETRGVYEVDLYRYERIEIKESIS